MHGAVADAGDLAVPMVPVPPGCAVSVMVLPCATLEKCGGPSASVSLAETEDPPLWPRGRMRAAIAKGCWRRPPQHSRPPRGVRCRSSRSPATRAWDRHALPPFSEPGGRRRGDLPSGARRSGGGGTPAAQAASAEDCPAALDGPLRRLRSRQARDGRVLTAIFDSGAMEPSQTRDSIVGAVEMLFGPAPTTRPCGPTCMPTTWCPASSASFWSAVRRSRRVACSTYWSPGSPHPPRTSRTSRQSDSRRLAPRWRDTRTPKT